MAYLTEKTKEKKQRNADIISDFKEMMKQNKGGQKVPVYEELAAKHGVSVATIGRVVNK